MIIDLDLDSAVPPYEQIRMQIADLATSGELPEGTRLPTIRQLAADLGIAPGTVARAYRELETAGVARSRVRHGTTILRPPRPTARQVRDGLATAARSYALAVRSLGVSRDDAVAALDRELGARTSA